MTHVINDPETNFQSYEKQAKRVIYETSANLELLNHNGTQKLKLMGYNKFNLHQ